LPSFFCCLFFSFLSSHLFVFAHLLPLLLSSFLPSSLSLSTLYSFSPSQSATSIMSPAPSSRNNRRSSTLANIPPPSGPPPPPPSSAHSTFSQGYDLQGYSSQSAHSSYSSHSGHVAYPGGFDPPRPSYSASSRGSPTGRSRSSRDYKSQDAWQDNSWRSIFDAALVKAQQAVQLDELRETALAANLYSQAANDLGRVIPICTNEKKKQSMLAIQAIYLDRVAQLRDTPGKSGVVPITPLSSHSPATSDSVDGSYSHHYSAIVNHDTMYDGESQQYSYQSYQPYQPPMVHHPLQLTSAPQLLSYQPPPLPPPIQQLEDQQDKGFRLFGKKRAKTQPSATQPPEIGLDNPNGHAPYGTFMNQGNDPYSAPLMVPGEATGGPPVIISPIFMSEPSVKNSSSQDPSNKSSKWRPFGKKKSKSFSSHEALSTNLVQDGAQVVPTATLVPAAQSTQHLVDPGDHADAYRAQADWYVENNPGNGYDDYDNPDAYYDEEDEDVDPYYIADTKGRAQAFEGKDSGKEEKKPEKPAEDPQPKSRKPLQHSASYNEEQSYAPNFAFVQPGSVVSLGQIGAQEPQLVPLGDELAYAANHTDDMEHNADDYAYNEEEQFMDTEEQLVGENEQALADRPETKGDRAVPFVSAFRETQIEPGYLVSGQMNESALEKSKSKRNWFGKKKKDPKDPKEKDLTKNPERIDNVAKLMEEAMFGIGGGSVRKTSKDNLKSRSKSDLPATQQQEDESQAQDQAQGEFKESALDQPILEEDAVLPVGDLTPEQDGSIPEQESEDATGGMPTSPEIKPVSSDSLKYSKSRHFSIFRGKKNKENKEVKETKEAKEDADLGAIAEDKADMDEDEAEKCDEGSSLSRSVTNEDSNSVRTRQSSKGGDRLAAEMAAALAISARLKDKDKKRDSGEYVPYEYQEEVEGPLMERVEVKENREIIGFVMPIEEIGDYTYEENEESALENWDSWVSQLESFEKVLSDKGLLKDKKKSKKNKGSPEEPLSPLGSPKGNRSSIFDFGRSNTIKSRTTLDLNSQLMDSRPLSMSTTLMDDTSIVPRTSFQSSRSGGSEATSTFPGMATGAQTKKRWWKRRDSSSLYRASSVFSVADVEQDRHLSQLLQSCEEVRSNEDLTLDTQALALPSNNTEPSSPSSGKDTAATPDDMSEASDLKEKLKEPKAKDEEQDEDDETPIAPMPKVKAVTKSKKPKLLPISTPLPQLLKLDNAEELWLYVQQAKTYATSRMNKGDKRSAAIALKRAQALESRWQEVLLEMASSDEDTDGLLEDDDEDEDEEEEEDEEPVAAPVKKVKETKKPTAKEIATSEPPSPIEKTASSTTTPAAPAPAPAPASAPVTLKVDTTTAINTPNNNGDDDDDEEDYMAQRRRSISRSNSTPDKYSKYKVNKAAAAAAANSTTLVSSSLEIVAEEETNEQGELSVKSPTSTHTSSDDGRLGSDATMDQMLATTNVEHLKFYIQRLKTDTVAKARSGSKFAALEGMKNVKVLQQRLEDLLNGGDAKETENAEEEKKEEEEEEEEAAVVVEEKKEEEEKKEDEKEDDDSTKASGIETEIKDSASCKTVEFVSDTSSVVVEKHQELEQAKVVVEKEP
ncbi:MAG: hypothetical protein J3Q66DRAFT_413936, partial [Benniella sp.]